MYNIFSYVRKKEMTHCSYNVSQRLLPKQNARVPFREFSIVHCQWTCLCGWESATYSSKLPSWWMDLLVRWLVGTCVKQRRDSCFMAHLCTVSLPRWAPGKSPPPPSQTHSLRNPLGTCRLPRTLGVGWLPPGPQLLFFSMTAESILGPQGFQSPGR